VDSVTGFRCWEAPSSVRSPAVVASFMYGRAKRGSGGVRGSTLCDRARARPSTCATERMWRPSRCPSFCPLLPSAVIPIADPPAAGPPCSAPTAS
jgi:hypothetical protein